MDRNAPRHPQEDQLEPGARPGVPVGEGGVVHAKEAATRGKRIRGAFVGGERPRSPAPNPSPRIAAMKQLVLLLTLALVLPCASACKAKSQQLVPMPPQDVEMSNPAVARVYLARTDQARGTIRGDGDQR